MTENTSLPTCGSKRVRGFLDEYTELVKKYGVSIEGCGCCGSPYVLDRMSDEKWPPELANGLRLHGDGAVKAWLVGVGIELYESAQTGLVGGI